jgi:hypothetical protein
MMYTAKDVATQEIYHFRKLSALVKRFGGTDWRVEHDSTIFPIPTEFTVQVLHRAYGQHAAFDVIARLRVASGDLVAAAKAEEEQ